MGRMGLTDPGRGFYIFNSTFPEPLFTWVIDE
jgi:hypothetical protein